MDIGRNWQVAATLAACSLWACGEPAAKAPTGVAQAADADASASTPDLGLLDVSTEAGAVVKKCPGDPGCGCASHEECSTGACADDGASATGKACAFPFGAGCAAGYVTFTAVVGEGATVCVPAAPKLCNPCSLDSDCAATGGSGALCVDQGAAGRFCGVACPTAGCRQGYACADATGSSGAKGKQCQASEQGVPPFNCACSVAAVALKLATACQTSNAAGTCGGQRVCGGGGLSGCSGKVATPESCNGQDDDCNGQTDEGPLCDDGNGCTVNDACTAGVCKPGAPKNCDDGDPCTVGDGCSGGNCASGTVKVCEGGQCNLGTCNKTTGNCAYATKGEGTPCDDGNACTQADVCAGAVCVGQVKPCDDKNPCTVDSCLPAGDCTASVGGDGNGCDDGEACTQGETCSGGQCGGGKVAAPCQCVGSSDCKDDGLVCNGVMYCDKSAVVWSCKVNPATVVVCGGGDNPCQVSSCSEASGKCAGVNLADGSTCSDGKGWTIGDSCQKGSCEAGADTKFCKVTADCKDDGDLCNGVPFCNKATGVCQVNPATVVVCPTADNTPCRESVCGAKTGVCALTPKNELKACEDGNLCTTGEACVAGICTASQGGDTCLCKQDGDCGKFEDGDGCNGLLFCNLGKQKCEVNPKSLVVCASVGDGPCATNVCNKGSGKCAMVDAVGKVYCDADGSACTPVDLCSGGKCVTDTANVCQCEQDGQCEDDGDKCNGVPYCDKAGNVCKVNPASVVVCSSAGDSACSVTACTPATGLCGKVAGVGSCSDGDACTVGDVCAGGACKAGMDTCGACKSAGDCDDKNACTSDSCSGQPLACSHSNNTAACSDGDACTTGDVCAGGGCKGKALICDDQEPCTSDACQGGTCVFLAANSATCTDGDACSLGDFCLNKLCKAGQGKADCDDNVACTVDSCDVFKGCLHVAGACSDNSACTSDACDLVKGCVFTAKPACDDGNGCTADSCDLVKGCVYLQTTVGCGDGNACTVGDKCGGGVCLAGVATNCDDGNSCSGDSCDAVKGCANAKQGDGTACGDGNACTLGDKCGGGVCLAGAVTGCDDGNVCTVDSCDKGKGCGNVVAVGQACGAGKVCDSKAVCVVNSTAPAGMALVPAGTFWMGCNATKDTVCSSRPDENPQHKVTLSAYYMDVTEVTVAEYKKCVDAGQCAVPEGGCSDSSSGNWDNAGQNAKAGRDQHPVNCVVWTESQKYCKWRGDKVDPANAGKYDLPTEAQWEMAARGDCEKNGKAASDDAGCKAAMRTHPWGEQAPNCSYAIMYDGSKAGCGTETTAAVGSKVAGASPYGLHDMSGNVYEWVGDWYKADYYVSSPGSNPFNSVSASYQVIRGGYVDYGAANLRSGDRDSGTPAFAYGGIGVRCARSAP